MVCRKFLNVLFNVIFKDGYLLVIVRRLIVILNGIFLRRLGNIFGIKLMK